MKILAITLYIIVVLPLQAFADGDIISSLKKKMSYLNKRQAVISENVANADTPGYKSKDLEPLELKSSNKRSRVKLAKTSPSHLGGSKKDNRFNVIKQKNTYDTALNGNNVVLEEQMVKLSEVDMEYKATVSIMRQMSGLVKAAIGDNK